MYIFSFSLVHFWSSRPVGVWGTHKKLERATHTLYIRLYSTVRHGGSRGPWQWCGRQHHGVSKVLAKGRATSGTQQGEIDRSVHTSLYRPARLPLCPVRFGVATNYIEYVPRVKWRRGWHKLKTLVGTFTILSYVRNFLLIFLSRIVTQSALYIFEM